MMAVDEGTAIGNARDALERVGGVVVEKVPDVIEATKAGLRSVADHGEALVAVLPASEGLGEYAKAGIGRVQGATDRARLRLAWSVPQDHPQLSVATRSDVARVGDFGRFGPHPDSPKQTRRLERAKCAVKSK